MSDLVERLRDWTYYSASNGEQLTDDAADEIERLRAEREHYKGKWEVWEDAARDAQKKNERLRAALERAVAYFDKPHLRTLHCSDEFDAAVDGMKEALRDE